MQRLTLTSDGVPVEYVLSTYRGDRYKFARHCNPGMVAHEPMIVSGRALLPEGEIHLATVLIEHGAIVRVAPGLDPAANIFTKGYIAPGFVELQINGAYGSDFSNDGRTVSRWPHACRKQASRLFCRRSSHRHGGLSAPVESGARGGAKCSRRAAAGVHLEGPYLNPARKGAHNPAFLRAPQVDEACAGR